MRYYGSSNKGNKTKVQNFLKVFMDYKEVLQSSYSFIVLQLKILNQLNPKIFWNEKHCTFFLAAYSFTVLVQPKQSGQNIHFKLHVSRNYNNFNIRE